jgi:predicted transcriptional regulator
MYSLQCSSYGDFTNNRIRFSKLTRNIDGKKLVEYVQLGCFLQAFFLIDFITPILTFSCFEFCEILKFFQK